MIDMASPPSGEGENVPGRGAAGRDEVCQRSGPELGAGYTSVCSILL